MSDTCGAATDYAEEDPDVRLMLQVRDGHAVAFEQLVERHQRRILNILRHLVGDATAAEDLAQEVFLRVFRARESYQPEAKFSTWLYTIVHRVASNALRSRSRRREVSSQVAGSGDSQGMPSLEQLAKEASGLMPTRQVDQGETAEMVRSAVEALNERQRMAVLLSKFEGMSYVDIAEAMDTTPKAVKSLLSRARAALRDVLEPYLAEGRRPADLQTQRGVT